MTHALDLSKIISQPSQNTLKTNLEKYELKKFVFKERLRSIWVSKVLSDVNLLGLI